MQWVMFSKMLGSLSVSEAGDRIAEIGFDGVDLTVRPGGHVLPENVAVDLPEAVKILEGKGLSVPMITTNIVAADEPYTEPILAAAAECRIPQLKLGYWQYKQFGELRTLINRVRRELAALEKLCEKHDVCVNIHSHSGNYLSASAGVVSILLEERNPQYIGAYLDPGHMTVEGGLGGWRIGIDLLSQHVNLVAVKDFAWISERKKEWRRSHAPLDQGIVRWAEVFTCLGQIGFDGTVSLHSEYGGLSVEELLSQTQEDFDYIRGVVASMSTP